MRNLFFLVLLFLSSVPDARAQDKNPVYVPADGIVPDEQTAIRIAEAVWIPIYGEKKVLEEQPYMATLDGKTWDVTSVSSAAIKDGTFKAQISKTDGRIISLSHSE